MNVKPTSPAIRLGRKEFAVGGFGYGLRQEFLKAEVSIGAPMEHDWAPIDEALATVIPASDAGEPTPRTPVDRIIRWTAELQRAGAQPVLDTGKLIGVNATSGHHVLALPTSKVEAAAEALLIVVKLINALIEASPPFTEQIAEAHSRVRAFVKTYSSLRIGGSNTPHLIRTAFDNRIPCFNLTEEVVQFGMGSKARRLESTLTDVTSAIAMRLARNKLAAASVLRQGGLPVPEHQLARSADEAVSIAEELGYPVVVKPADRDGGTAVAAGITNQVGVRDAWETARAESKNVMVEKHVHGRDYRLVVHDGKLIWALERIPGGVTGDGVSTVSALIERVNAEPARAERSDAPLKPLDFDREAAELLASYGMTLESVPAKGDRIRLRRAANVATGGTPEAAFDRVHPDNARLAERAAALLGLDLAGIDLLIPDVSRSWRESGAAICEVNAQPTLGYTTSKHLYGQIVKSLVKGEGRIPIVLVAGAPPDSAVAALVARILVAAGLRTAIASASGCVNGDKLIHASPRTVFDAARAALIDRDTDALVVAMSDASVLATGLPFDRYSSIALAGRHFGSSAGASTAAFARLMLPHSLGGLAVPMDLLEWRPVLAQLRNARVVMSTADGDAAAREKNLPPGCETAVMETAGDGWRLMLGGNEIDVGGVSRNAPPSGTAAAGPMPACSPEDVALAAATAQSLGMKPEIIRRGLMGLGIAGPGKAA